MKSAQILTLEHLQKKGSISSNLAPISLSSTTLNFTYQHKVPRNSSSRLLLALANHQTYYGTIVNAKAQDDHCIFIFSDGAFYKGQCKNGKFQGKGVLTKYGEDFKEELFSYEGDWHLSKPHGLGKEKILNSMTYEGHFVDGKKSGKGAMTYIDGTKYEGQFKRNEIEGKGTYKTKAHEWIGTWKQGYLEGEGQQVSYGIAQHDDEEEEEGNDLEHELGKDSVYKGGFLRGLKHGQGTYKWGKNFSEYSGTFSNGQLDGEGHFRLGKAEYKGRWKKGVELALESTIQFKRVKKAPSFQGQ